MAISFIRIKALTLNLRQGISTETGDFKLYKSTVLTVANTFALQARFTPTAKSKKSGVKDPYYDVIIAFHDLQFLDEPDRDHPFKVVITQKSGLLGWRRTQLVRYMTKPSLGQSNCKVTCTCPDFYWTWYWYVSKNINALAGYEFTRPKGVRVTDGKPYGDPGPAKRNKANTPGMCKHIAKFGEWLAGNDVIHR